MTCISAVLTDRKAFAGKEYALGCAEKFVVCVD